MKNNLLFLSFISLFILNEAKSQFSYIPVGNTKDTVFIGYIDGKHCLFHLLTKEDNLFSIASYYGISITALKDINGITNNQIQENKIIKIPI
ncbi:MAG: LysM peptidoglycan-binding domain-containing protein, partial [Bacteroidota bacterium]